MSSFKVAVVGLGNAGHTLHLPALAGLQSIAAVVAAVDPDAGRRQRAADTWKVPTFDSFDAALGAKPDVVIVGTPPHTHAELCLRAFDAGAHVICEKPFASSLDEADEVIAAAERAGKRIALNHEFREMPIFRALRDAVDGERGGGPVVAQAWQLMDLPPWAEPNWRAQMPMRTLYEAGVHLVDFLMALFGEKPLAVTSQVSTCGVKDEESDAVALVALEFSRGRLGHIVQNRLCKGETQYFEVRADTRQASYRASFGGRARVSAGLHRSTKPHVRVEFGASGLVWKETGHDRQLLGRNPKDPAMVATRLLIERTLAAFRDGGRPPATAQDGRDVLEVIAACYHSAATGRRVELAAATELAGMAMGATAGGSARA